MKRNDLILVGIVLLVSLVLLIGVHFIQKQQGDRVIIKLDGKVYGQYPLTEDKTITIQTSHGMNQVEIKQNKVSIRQADCPDQVCVRHRPIDSPYQSIICLPHKLVVEVKKTETEEIDIIGN